MMTEHPSSEAHVLPQSSHHISLPAPLRPAVACLLVLSLSRHRLRELRRHDPLDQGVDLDLRRLGGELLLPTQLLLLMAKLTLLVTQLALLLGQVAHPITDHLRLVADRLASAHQIRLQFVDFFGTVLVTIGAPGCNLRFPSRHLRLELTDLRLELALLRAEIPLLLT